MNKQKIFYERSRPINNLKPLKITGLDKKYSAVVAEIDKHISYWKPILGLDNWNLNLIYTLQSCSNDETVRARTQCFFEYKSAKIEFYLCAYAGDTPSEREDTVVHELVHCLIDPLNVDQDARKLLEMVTVDVTQSLLRLKYKGKR